MKFLLTSAGISNPSIHEALVELLGKPIAESSALFVPTGIYPFSGGAGMARQAICGEARSTLCELGWQSLGVLELTALPSIKEDAWIPELRKTDALLVWGGDVMYLYYWMRKSGLAGLLPALNELVYVGVSAGSIVVTPYNHDAEFDLGNVPEGSDRGQEEGDRAMGLVDFTLVPHLDHPDFVPEHSVDEIKSWAAGVPVPTYAIDDNTAITVIDGAVDVISEGQWKRFASSS
jgi:dipeptidase E